ncbi:MAG: prolyl oligopeptidase family serine peptidase, partial [Planctomycetota bacterium]
ENGTDGISAISNKFGIQVWEMKRTFPFVAVPPQCRPEARGWTAAGQDKALAILDHVAEKYGTDPDRGYVTGVSSGGIGVWNIVSSNPGRFAAAIPVCAGGGGSVESLAGQRTRVWLYETPRAKSSVLGHSVRPIGGGLC